MKIDLNALVFVDCYALSSALPSTERWVLVLEGYEALHPDKEESAVVPGGPHQWEITFKNLFSIQSLQIAPSFAKDFSVGQESCEIYKLKSERVTEKQFKVEIKSDYVNGFFMCEWVQIKRVL